MYISIFFGSQTIPRRKEDRVMQFLYLRKLQIWLIVYLYTP